MTRWELLTSDEYFKAQTECTIRSGRSVKEMRKEMDEFLLAYRDELLHGEQPVGGCRNPGCKVCYRYHPMEPS